jgi:N-acetyl-anhydromuramyl-L-alanine amidase AmpD
MEKQSNTRKVKQIIIHCSDTYARMDIGAEEIRKWHTEERGWKDIGYHFVIRRDGTLETGRDLDKDGDIFEEVGAHTVGYNGASIAICMVGGKGDDGKAENNFTLKQFETLESTLRFIKSVYPKATTHGHREFAQKECPSFDVQRWLKGRKL